MIVGIDLQFLHSAGDRGDGWPRLLAAWRRAFPEDQLIGYGDPAADKSAEAALKLDGVRRWEFPFDKADLLDGGPMASHAWRTDCLELDWLLVPEPLDLGVLLPGGAPCRLAALLGGLPERPAPAPDRPHMDANLQGRNYLDNRLQAIAHYERIAILAPENAAAAERCQLPADRLEWIAPAIPVDDLTHCVQALRERLVKRQERFPKPRPSTSGKPPLAIFTPVRPIRSGISDYSEKALPHLKEHFDVTVFVDGYEPRNAELFDKTSWLHQADFGKWRALGHARAAPLYVMGNNECHKNIYQLSHLIPGVVELHDMTPLAYGTYATNFWMNRKEWDEAILREHGERYKDMEAEETPKDEAPFHLRPMPRTVLAGAKGAILHNEWALKLVREKCPDIPMVNTGLAVRLQDAPAAPRTAGPAFRKKFGLPPDSVLFAIVGEVTWHKRFREVIQAFAQARAIRNDIELVIVGGTEDEQLLDNLKACIRRSEAKDSIRVLGRLNALDFQAAVHETDVGVNLRWPTVGETSAAIADLMVAGKPVMVTDRNQFCEYPDEACWKIPAGGCEIEALAQAMLTLAARPDIHRRIGRNARRYIEQFSWEKVTGVYVDFLSQFAGDAS